jgi:hypothetical protein
MKWLAFVLALAACSAERKKCARMADLAEKCWSSSVGTDNMEDYCTLALVQERDSAGGRSLADDMFDAMTECTKATTCDELTSCLDRHGCNLTFTSPTSDPTFQCWPKAR